MSLLAAIGWVALALILWTHLGYPILAFVWSKLLPRQIHAADIEPFVATRGGATTGRQQHHHGERHDVQAHPPSTRCHGYPHESRQTTVPAFFASEVPAEL